MPRIFMLLCFLLTFLHLQAERVIEVEKYTTRDGLSSDIIYRAFTDSRGFLWLATADGLNRFDGKDFKVFRHIPNDSTSIAGNIVYFITEDAEHNLWIMTSGGLCKYLRKQNRFVRFHFPWIDKVEKQYNLQQSLMFAGDKIWFTDYEGINQIDPPTHRVKRFKLAQPYQGRHLISLGKDRFGGIYAGNIEGTFRLNEATGIFEKSTLPLPAAATLSFSNDSQNNFWITMWAEGAIRVDLKSGTATKYGGTETNYQVFEVAPDSFLLCGDYPGMLSFSRNHPEFQPVGLINEITGLNEGFVIHSVHASGKDLVWMCGNKGLLKWDRRPKKFRKIKVEGEGMQWPLKINAIAADPVNENELWVSVWYQNLVRHDVVSGKTRYYFNKDRKPLSSLPWGYYNAFYSDQDGGLLITGEHGIWQYDRNRDDFVKLKRPQHPESLIHLPCFKIIKIKNGHFLSVIRGKGLIEFNPDLSFYREYPFRFTDMNMKVLIISSIVEVNDHTILFCSVKTGLFSLNRRTGQFARITQDPSGIPMPGNMWMLEKDPKDRIWVGTHEGVLLLDSNLRITGQYTHENGLPSNHIQHLLKDRKGNMWVSTRNGLSLFEPSGNTFRNFSQSDGMVQNDSYVMNELANGEVAVGHEEGISIMNYIPGPQNADPPPNVQFTEIRVQNKELSAAAATNLSVEYGEGPVQIRFASIDFLNTENTSYSYRLEGASNEWIQLGNTNVISFYELPPGKYRLMVRSMNAYGQTTETPAVLKLEVKAPFYLTWWFRLLTLSLTGGVAYSFYRVRNQKRKELEGVRARISRDLHDDIGSTLSSINILTRSAKKRLHENDHTSLGDSLEKISDRTGRLLDNMNDIIWSVKPENDSLESIISRMREYASTILEAKKISFAFDFPEHPGNETLSLDIKNNIFMIYKEAINNCAKYSECTHVNIRFAFQQGKFELVIADNGKGFREEALPETGSIGGNGLLNMKKRASESGGQLEIKSSPGHGTTVKFSK